MVITACDGIDQPLQIAGDQNIHGRRRSENKVTILIIAACPEEIIENLVLIGGTDQPGDGYSHLPGIVGGQDISEIAGGNHHIDLLSFLNLLSGQEGHVAVYIVDDLGNQASDIDGIGTGELIAGLIHFPGKGRIGEHTLYSVLGIIKIPLNTDYTGIVPSLGNHLLFLDGAYPVLGVENDDLCPRHIRKAGQSGLACVAAGCCKNHDLIFHMILAGACSQQIGENGKSHILKGDRCPMEKFQIESITLFGQGRNGLHIKLTVIGMIDAITKLFLRKVGQEKAHHFVGNLLIGLVRQLGKRDGECRDLIRDK